MIIVAFSSEKNDKVEPVLEVLGRLYPDLVSVRKRIGEDETHIPSQPVGRRETKLGAERRADLLRDIKPKLQDKLLEEQKIETSENDTWIYVGVEGGVILNSEKFVEDVTYVALLNDRGIKNIAAAPSLLMLDKEGNPFQPNGSLYEDELYTSLPPKKQSERNLCIFGPKKGEAELTKDEYTPKSYREIVVEPLMINLGKDLYEWSSKGKYTRKMAIEQAAERAARAFYLACEMDSIERESKDNKFSACKHVLTLAAKYGCVASLGKRYRNMVWMRDLSFMACSVIRLNYKKEVEKALTGFKKRQEKKSGQIPIVFIPDEKKRDFLEDRISSWRDALRKYCNQNLLGEPDNFPKPPAELEDLDESDLMLYYNELTKFHFYLPANDSHLNRPSLSLSKFMLNELGQLTPGTRDSEIHFILTLMELVDASKDPADQKRLLDKFASALAGAMFFLYMNVIDGQDGLPCGADSRDIFADFLFDAKALSNASYWYQALSLLIKYAALIEKTSFKDDLRQLLNQKNLQHEPGQSLLDLESQTVPNAFLLIQMDLKKQIRNKLLYNENSFQPRDFIPGKIIEEIRAGTGKLPEKITSILPPHITRLIDKQDDAFLEGKVVDPQGLALAVLNGLVDKEDYECVIALFQKCDSDDLGVRVFVPISATVHGEIEIIEKNDGLLVWPNVSSRVVEALYFINTDSSKKLAFELLRKLDKLPGIFEWYVIGADGKGSGHGSGLQIWHACGMQNGYWSAIQNKLVARAKSSLNEFLGKGKSSAKNERNDYCSPPQP